MTTEVNNEEIVKPESTEETLTTEKVEKEETVDGAEIPSTDSVTDDASLVTDEENSDEKPLVAKAKVEIDQTRYKYVPLEKAKLEEGIAYSNYSAIGRDYINSIILRIRERQEYIKDALRNEPLTSEESRALILENKQLDEFIEPFLEVFESISVSDTGISGLLDERGHYKRGISFGNENPRMIVGTPPKVDLSAAAKPEIFLNVLTAALGSATEIRFPLPASGFTLTLSAPTKPEIIGMVSRINRMEQKIARSLVGYTFTAQVGQTLREIINLFLAPERIRRCSLQVPNDDIVKYIKRADIDVLLAHFAWLMHPTGYNYILKCLNTVNKETGIEGEQIEENCGYHECATVDILDMVWYDNSRLTERQRNDLSRSSHTVEQIYAYQQESIDNYLKEYSTIEIIPNSEYHVTSKQIEKVIIKLKSPNLIESLDSDDEWLVRLDKFLDESGASTMSNEDRLGLADQISSSMIISMYSSYIDSIEMIYTDDGGQQTPIVSKDKQAIESALEAISNNYEYANVIGNKISEYIERTRIGMMGVPNNRCPKCNLPQPKEIDGAKLIPINPLRDFFTVCHIKIQ